MAAVLAHWDVPDVWLDPAIAKKYFIHWSHTCKGFGITDIGFVQNVTIGDYGDSQITLRKFNTLQEGIDHYTAAGFTPVYVEQGGTLLEQYTFPTNPVFVFGSDYGQLPQADVSFNSTIGVHAEVAMGIVLNKWVNG